MDERNQRIFSTRMEAFDACEGPRVGDWVYLRGEAAPRRFTHDWGDDIQVGQTPGDCGSFYLGGGWLSYSGSLDAAIRKDELVKTEETLPGRVWFFNHDIHQAHNGIDAEANFRVFRQD